MRHAAAASDEGLEIVIRPSIETVIGRSYADAGTVDWDLADSYHAPVYHAPVYVAPVYNYGFCH